MRDEKFCVFTVKREVMRKYRGNTKKRGKSKNSGVKTWKKFSLLFRIIVYTISGG